MSVCRENFPQGIRSGPRLWHLPDLLPFILKYVFLKNSGAVSNFFFVETLGWMFEFRFVKYKKNRLIRPLKVGSNLRLW